MTWNILGSLLLMAIFSVGALVIWFVLKRSGGQGLNNEAAAGMLLKNFRYFVVVELVIGAVVGWIVGPIIFGAMGGA